MADDNQGEGTPFTSHAMRVDIDLVRALAQVLDETDLTEVEVEDGARKVRVVRKPAPVQAAASYAPAPAYAPAPQQPQLAAPTIEAGAAAAPISAVPPVTSPMVGTVYLAANPEAKPFVSVGQKVAAGDTLVIIEAMKVMNPIVAPAAGTVTQVLVSNGQPVEFDQPLVVVE
ncbi:MULTISPECIES: acetyl-CoA carboxylase biotin carboxyl carrier protein [unclassified Sphingomonas]|jgi:acetyl-CoA carboxylase biotin carboxyl carrier protein|uniref:acetyl-CoA carboxylase biotin carboxyl carrier protein n=1 Tax=unclassified Sphingomonas TaxID=196159 RepID=UPI0006F78C58|nr:MULTISPECIES: acetyl-CoA carboxylase biotin carboxyl carrier protein [unclassified Sphingomonas]KQM24742.1 acetyl-CoA carboxylase biotin carboxyl carrier protein subunit [Sphingomonas sp. Leaf9]KQM42400.1 acetyl-CoA carboxylase biotin carboxyl carrier protein subunit [Sphingomonas sp. Leaf11]KQM85481.1 acetyl-CoA carboxylase biotin carboxyl carrier protein subunit [Sphingomonas sp. Leaf23]